MKYVRIYEPDGSWNGYVTNNLFELLHSLDNDLLHKPTKVMNIKSIDELKPCSLCGFCPLAMNCNNC